MEELSKELKLRCGKTNGVFEFIVRRYTHGQRLTKAAENWQMRPRHNYLEPGYYFYTGTRLDPATRPDYAQRLIYSYGQALVLQVQDFDVLNLVANVAVGPDVVEQVRSWAMLWLIHEGPPETRSHMGGYPYV